MSVMIQEFGVDLSRKMDDQDRAATEAFLMDLAGEYVKANGKGIAQIESEMTEVMTYLTVGLLPW